MAGLVVVALAATGISYVSWVRPRLLDAERTAFVMRWIKGQRSRYHMVMTVSGSFVQQGHRLAIDERLAMDMAWQVVSVDRNGAARLRVRLSNGVDVTNGTRMRQEPQTFFMRVARDGRVLTGADLGTTTGQSTDPGIPGMDQITPILPTGRVRPGDEWATTFRQVFPFSSDRLRYTTRSKLLRYETLDGTRTAVIDGSMSVPVHVRFDLKAMAAAIGQRSRLPKDSNPWISLDGTVDVHQIAWFDVIRREASRARSTGRFAMTIRMGGLPAASAGSVRFSGTITVDLTRR